MSINPCYEMRTFRTTFLTQTDRYLEILAPTIIHFFLPEDPDEARGFLLFVFPWLLFEDFKTHFKSHIDICNFGRDKPLAQHKLSLNSPTYTDSTAPCTCKKSNSYSAMTPPERKSTNKTNITSK